jgi:hypothetical protein
MVIIYRVLAVLGAIVAMGAVVMLSGVLGGGYEPGQAAKILVVCLFVGFLVLRMLWCVTTISAAKQEIIEATESLDHLGAGMESARAMAAKPSPQGRALQAALDRGAVSPTPDAAVSCAALSAREWSARIDRERSFGSAAVYLGLAGTLIGLTISVAGLGNLEAEGDGLRQQILAVIGGFSSSFFAALAGVMATVGVGLQAARYDGLVDEHEDVLESYIGGRLFPTMAKQQQAERDALEMRRIEMLSATMASTVGAAISQLAPNLVKQNDALIASALSAKEAADRSRECAETLAESAKELVGGAKDVGLAAIELAKHVKALSKSAQTFEQILGIIGGIGDTMNKVFGELVPLFESTAKLRKALDQAAAFPAQAEAVMLKMTDELRSHETAMRGIIGEQTQTQKATLEQLQEQILLLRAAVHDYSAMVRDMPASAAAERISRELDATVGQVQEKELARQAALREQLEAVHGRVQSLLQELERAGKAAQKDLTDSAQTLKNASSQVWAIQERLDNSILVPKPWSKK